MTSSPFLDRLIIGTAATLLLGALIYYSHHPAIHFLFCLLLALVVSTALFEYYALAEKKGFQAARSLGIAASFAYILLSGYSVYCSIQLLLVLALVIGVTLCSFLIAATGGLPPLATTAITLFPQIYITLPLGCAIWMTHINATWLVYAVVLTKITDVAAYLIGKAVGTIPLCPKVSPKKTVEGALGGIACAVLASLASAPLFPQISWPFLVFLGMTTAVAAEAGDLLESLLKRDASVKDSGHLPGFGGVLDMVDSLVFSLPFLYFVLIYLKI